MTILLSYWLVTGSVGVAAAIAIAAGKARELAQARLVRRDGKPRAVAGAHAVDRVGGRRHRHDPALPGRLPVPASAGAAGGRACRCGRCWIRCGCPPTRSDWRSRLALVACSARALARHGRRWWSRSRAPGVLAYWVAYYVLWLRAPRAQAHPRHGAHAAVRRAALRRLRCLRPQMAADDLRQRRRSAYETARPDVQALVPVDARSVLDVGCASGALGAALKAPRRRAGGGHRAGPRAGGRRPRAAGPRDRGGRRRGARRPGELAADSTA